MPKRVPGTKDAWEMVCDRCGGIRWLYSRAEPAARYRCIRCRIAIAGRKARARPLGQLRLGSVKKKSPPRKPGP
jgi:hypothetical protein